MLPESMKVSLFNKFGGPEVFETAERPLPEMKAGYALVKQTYVGIMFGDIIDRRNLFEHPNEEERPFPKVTGYEGTGVVVELKDGPGMPPDIQVGTRVVFDDDFQAYAEYVAGPANRFVRIPDDIPDEAAVAVFHEGIAAHVMTTKFRPVSPGDYALVTGARGAAGMQLVSWLAHLGANVIGLTRDPANVDFIKSLGAWEVIAGDVSLPDEVHRLTGGKGIQIAIDGVGGPAFHDVVESLGQFGIVICYGITGGNYADISPTELIKHSRTVAGSIHTEFIEDRPSLLHHSNAVFDASRAGIIVPRVHSTHPLEDMRKIHEIWETGDRHGKVLVKF